MVKKTVHPYVTPEDVRFFHENAGGIVGERYLAALHLARAEAYADDRANGLRFTWEHDIDPDLSWCECEDPKRRKGRPEARIHHDHTVLVAMVRDTSGNVLASLGGIVDPDANYRRIIEAELALEVLTDRADRSRRDVESLQYMAL